MLVSHMIIPGDFKRPVRCKEGSVNGHEGPVMETSLTS